MKYYYEAKINGVTRRSVNYDTRNDMLQSIIDAGDKVAGFEVVFFTIEEREDGCIIVHNGL